jgi:hypothetical protein
MAKKTRTPEQKERRRQRDQERREGAEISQARAAPPAERPPIPELMVQRMGKLFRIAYKETRNLAKYNSGEAVDEGGFTNETDAQIKLSQVLGEQGPTVDAEEESLG